MVKQSFFLILFLTIAFQMQAFFVINKPSAIIYENPKDHAHIEDILRYGTYVNVTQEKEEWVHITYPGLQGWILKDEILELKNDPEMTANACVGFRGAYFFKEPDTEWGPFLHLPFESPFEVMEELPQSHNRWILARLQDGQTGYVPRAHVMLSHPKLTLSEMVSFSKKFMGTKYLWGGTTSFGYDCSGFTQMLYRQMGITLPRNSYQQASDDRFVDVKPDEAKEGDLVFFKNSSGRVSHVGMMINSKEFIHSFAHEEACICISFLEDNRWENGYFYYGKALRRFNH